MKHEKNQIKIIEDNFFINGLIENGYSEEEAETMLIDTMKNFNNYMYSCVIEHTQ